MKRKIGMVLLLLISFLVLAPIAFADSPIEIQGETHIIVGQQYEYELMHVQKQPIEVNWYFKEPVEGVSIENYEGNMKAKLYVSQHVPAQSIELIVKIKEDAEANNRDTTPIETVVTQTIDIEQPVATSAVMSSPTEINIESAFPDPVFADYIKTYYDLDHNQQLSEEEIAKVQIININGLQIKQLTGIENFYNLVSLTLYNIPVEKLDVHSLTKLMSLSCQQMPLKTIVIENQAIQTLTIKNTQLTTLDLKNNPLLTSVDCSQNEKLSSIQFDSNSQINTLNCKLSAFTSLNLDMLTEITELQCGNNPLTSLDLSHNTKLKYLNVSSCQQLSSLNVNQCTDLLELRAGTNALKTLDVTNNLLLTLLDVSSNQIQSIDLSHNSQLQNLNIMQNCLSTIDVSQNTKLSTYQALGYHHIHVSFQYDAFKGKWISQPLSFLDTKVFSGDMFTSSANPMTYDDTTKCFIIPKAQTLSSGTMQSTFVLPGNHTTKNLNARLDFHFICQVDFHTMGGTPQLESLQEEYGNLLIEPTAPTRQGYIFNGWYQDENMTMPWDFQNDHILENMTLYAKWTPQHYQVNFHHPFKDIETQIVSYQELVKEPEIIEKEHYLFKGWYTDQQYQHPWHFLTQPVTDHLDLYASYQEIVQAPQSDVVSGSQMKKGQQIILSTQTKGAKIYYTRDGSEPTLESELYTKPIPIEEETMISAIAVKANCIDSPISVFRYTIQSMGQGDVVIQVNGKNNLTVADDQSLLDAILTPDDFDAYHQGQDILITLDCQTMETSPEFINQDDIKGYHIGQYLDICIYKQIGNLQREKITQLNHPIQLTLQVPEELLPQNGEKRTFYVLRIHNGKTTLLFDKDTIFKTITIDSDCFSTYVILYQDEKRQTSQVKQSIGTYDDSDVLIYMILMSICCLGVGMFHFVHKE